MGRLPDAHSVWDDVLLPLYWLRSCHPECRRLAEGHRWVPAFFTPGSAAMGRCHGRQGAWSAGRCARPRMKGARSKCTGRTGRHRALEEFPSSVVSLGDSDARRPAAPLPAVLSEELAALHTRGALSPRVSVPLLVLLGGIFCLDNETGKSQSDFQKGFRELRVFPEMRWGQGLPLGSVKARRRPPLPKLAYCLGTGKPRFV